jgi:hypothetical protein
MSPNGVTRRGNRPIQDSAITPHSAAQASKEKAPGPLQLQGLLYLVAGARSDRLHTAGKSLAIRIRFIGK